MSESTPEGRWEAVVEELSEDKSLVLEPDLPIQTENSYVQLFTHIKYKNYVEKHHIYQTCILVNLIASVNHLFLSTFFISGC